MAHRRSLPLGSCLVMFALALAGRTAHANEHEKHKAKHHAKHEAEERREKVEERREKAEERRDKVEERREKAEAARKTEAGHRPERPERAPLPHAAPAAAGRPATGAPGRPPEIESERRAAVGPGGATFRPRHPLSPEARVRIVHILREQRRERVQQLWVERQVVVVAPVERRRTALASWWQLYPPPAPPVTVVVGGAATPTSGVVVADAPAVGAPVAGASAAGAPIDSAPAPAATTPPPTAPAPAPADGGKSVAEGATCAPVPVEQRPLELDTAARPRVFFGGFASDVVEPSGTKVLTELAAAEVQLPAGASLVTRDDVDALLQAEKVKDLTGCDDQTSLETLGAAMSADYVMTGTVEQLGDEYVVSLRLVDAQKATRVAAVSYRCRALGCAATSLDAAAHQLVHTPG